MANFIHKIIFVIPKEKSYIVFFINSEFIDFSIVRFNGIINSM